MKQKWIVQIFYHILQVVRITIILQIACSYYENWVWFINMHRKFRIQFYIYFALLNSLKCPSLSPWNVLHCPSKSHPWKASGNSPSPIELACQVNIFSVSYGIFSVIQRMESLHLIYLIFYIKISKLKVQSSYKLFHLSSGKN